MAKKIHRRLKPLITSTNSGREGTLAVFNGGSGSDRSQAARKVARSLQAPLVWVDVSQLQGATIGETEKNLEQILDTIEQEQWVLFLDEADALFGKRTQIRDAHDRYSNENKDFLIDRLRNASGLVILSMETDVKREDRYDHLITFPLQKRWWRWDRLWSALPGLGSR